MKKILLCLFLIHTDTAYSANCELDTQDSALCEAANGGDAGAQVTQSDLITTTVMVLP